MFSAHFSRLSLLSLRGFTKSKNTIFKAVVRDSINLLESGFMVSGTLCNMLIKKKMGWTIKYNLRALEKKNLKEIENQQLELFIM